MWLSKMRRTGRRGWNVGPLHGSQGSYVWRRGFFAWRPQSTIGCLLLAGGERKEEEEEEEEERRGGEGYHLD